MVYIVTMHPVSYLAGLWLVANALFTTDSCNNSDGISRSVLHYAVL